MRGAPEVVAIFARRYHVPSAIVNQKSGNAFIELSQPS
jgi:hypothetical protein